MPETSQGFRKRQLSPPPSSFVGLRLGFPLIWDQAKADEALASGANPGTEIKNKCHIEKNFLK